MADVKSDPLYYTHVKLLASSLHKLKLYKGMEGVYNFFGHPITKVELMGIVISKATKTSHTLIMVDDGTGLVQCKLWHKKENNTTDQSEEREFTIQLGNLIQIWGKIQNYQELREINAFNFRIIDDVNEEMLAWLDIVNVTLKSYMPNALT